MQSAASRLYGSGDAVGALARRPTSMHLHPQQVLRSVGHSGVCRLPASSSSSSSSSAWAARPATCSGILAATRSCGNTSRSSGGSSSGYPLAAGLLAPGAARRGCISGAGGVAARAAASPAAGAPGDAPLAGAASFLSAFWKFLRPHTIRGTILGTSSVVARALLDNPNPIDWGLLPRAMLGLAALLCGNGYIVGINQIYDVEIDALNKPFLPVAAGELSKGAAWLLCAALASAGLAIVASNFGPLISGLYAFGLLLGTVYSVPPLRLKRFAVAAFMIIACVRGFLLNFGVYHAARAALQLPFVWSPPIAFITVFVTMFATVIAITKDLPDVEGDQAHNIQTFATRMGVPAVSNLGISLLMLNYAGAVYLGLSNPSAFRVPVMVGAHSVLAAVLALRTVKLARAGYTKQAVQKFYQWVWNLFYAEYLLLPFV